MAGNFSKTTNFLLRYLLGTSKVSDVDEGFANLAKDVDSKMLGYEQDTFAKRPAAGIPNRIFKATDTGLLYHDTGSGWEQLIIAGQASAYTVTSATKAAAEAGIELSASRDATVTFTGEVKGLKVGAVSLGDGFFYVHVKAGEKLIATVALTYAYRLL